VLDDRRHSKQHYSKLEEKINTGKYRNEDPQIIDKIQKANQLKKEIQLTKNAKNKAYDILRSMNNKNIDLENWFRFGNIM